jgi:hypothetical protein
LPEKAVKKAVCWVVLTAGAKVGHWVSMRADGTAEQRVVWRAARLGSWVPQ